MPLIIQSRLMGPVASAIVLAALAGCSNNGSSVTVAKPSLLAKSSTVSSTARAAQTPSAILGRALSAMRAMKSVHVDCTLYGLGDDTESEDIGVDSGRIASNAAQGGSITTLLVDGIAYLNIANPNIIALNGISATEAGRLAGQWISFHKGDSFGALNYPEAIRGMTLDSQAAALQLTGALKLTPPRMVQGESVESVSGTATPYYTLSAATKGSLETVYFAASGTPLPVSVSAHPTNGNVTTCNFSQWNEPLHLTAPPQSVRVTAIPSASSAT